MHLAVTRRDTDELVGAIALLKDGRSFEAEAFVLDFGPGAGAR